MGVDLSYPNDEAIEHIGILDKFNNGEIEGFTTKHPDGWVQAVIDKVQAEIDSNYNPQRPEAGGNVDWSNYSAEERAAYEWFRSDVIETSAWKGLVDDYKKNEAPKEEDIAWEKYQDPDSYDIKGDIGAPEVKVYTGGDNKNGELKVSTEAIRHFAAQINKVAWRGGGMLLDASTNFNTLNIRPGKFAKAEVMRQKIAGNGDEDLGLIGDTQGLLVKVHQALFTLSESLVQMANSYERTEDGNLRTGEDLKKRTADFNKMTEAEFGKVMVDPWAHIGDTGDFGQVSTDGSKGSGDSGSSGSGGDGK